MLPTFLVLGAPRTGTTWLHAVLSHHPEIHVPDCKEPDFLNRRILNESFSKYTALFDSPAGQAVRSVRGDMSVNYSHLLGPVVREIARILPDVQLVYTLRNPVDRLWSNLKYTYGTFSHRVMRTPPLAKFLRACHSARFNRRNDYQSVMEIWSQAFGKDRLHIDLFDRMEQDPRGYVRDLLAHIGADPNWEIPDELLTVRIHSTEALTMPEVFRWYLSNQWLEPTRQLNEVLGGRVTHWVESMQEAASQSTFSRRMLRCLNRAVLSLPERLAYAAYDARRNQALLHRLRQINPVPDLRITNASRSPNLATMELRPGGVATQLLEAVS